MAAGPGIRAPRAFRRPGKRRKGAVVLVAVFLALAALISWEIHSVNKRAALQASGLGAQRLTAVARPAVQRPIQYVLEYASRQSADYSQECQQRYHGLPFLQTINDSWQQPVCSPQGSGPLNSSIRCWYQFDEYAEAYCTGGNLALDLTKFAEEDASLPHVTSNRNSQRLFESHPRAGLSGELLGDCKLDGTVAGGNMWREESFGKGGQKWLHHSFKSTVGDAKQPQCVAWVEHPLYFLNDKYDSINVWHALEDVTHAFEAYALKGWGSDAQVVVLDEKHEDTVLGPTYLPVWQKVFSPLRPPTTLRKLVANLTQQHKGSMPPGAAICFKDVFFSVHGGISVLSRSGGGWTPCRNSTMMNALVHFMLDGLQLSDVKPDSHSGHSGAQQGLIKHAEAKLRVVWALRSNRAGFQQDVLQQLQKHLPSESGAEVVAVDFGGLSIEEQIRRVRQADVLVGYHGAALTLALFMNWQSGLVEIEESFRCFCYTNCAVWRDHPYSLIKANEFDGAAGLATKVVSEVETMLLEVKRRIQDAL